MKKAGKKGKIKAVKTARKPTKPAKKPVLKAKADSPKSLKPAAKEKVTLAMKGKGASLSPKAVKNGMNVQAEPAPAKGKKGGAARSDKKTEIIAEIIAAQKNDAEIVLTNADGKQYCRVHDCDNEATTDGHCRLHYLALWKRNRIKAKILQGGKLDKYIEDLTAKYPDKYLEMLRKDLASEKDFNLIITEMDVEDAGDEAESEEDTSRFIEEVRGGMPTPDDDEGAF